MTDHPVATALPRRSRPAAPRPRAGRNARCPCGSGKKHKQCCGADPVVPAPGLTAPGRQWEALYHAGHYAVVEAQAGAVLARDPTAAEAWRWLGAARLRLGKNALEAFRTVVKLMPHHAGAHADLGALLAELGHLDQAVASYRAALALDAAHAQTHFNLGNALRQQGHYEAAAASYRHALAQAPQWSEAYNSLGLALQALQRYGEALDSYRHAVARRPDNIKAVFNLARLLQFTGDNQGAAQCYRRALALNPDAAHAASALSGLGASLHAAGLAADAVPCLVRACQLEPAVAAHAYNLGVLHQHGGDAAAAAAAYQRALLLDPALAEAHNNLGVCLRDLGRLDDGLASCRHALRLKPALPLAHNNLGLLLKDAGRLDDAIAAYRRAVTLDPGYVQAHSNLVYLLPFHPDYDDGRILAEARAFAAAHGADRCPQPAASPPSPTPPRPLRIGYLSPDLREHPIATFMLPLLSHHDRTHAEVFCYADVARPDPVTRRLAAAAHNWRPVHGLSEAQLAERIRRDGIDILVDLSMHMAHGRPLLFAMKPAPLQVAWLAYPGTTGLAAMDYRLTDPWLDPPAPGDDRYSESSLRLPHTFWCYGPLVDGIDPNPLPALAAGRVTFGCLNNFCKVSDATLRNWGEIMARVPASHLLLVSPPGRHRQRVLDILAAHAVAAERVEFIGQQSRENYLRTYHRIDLCLDTLPYNGHTTSLDACWMGVPVVSQVGHTVVGRAGWSQLNNLGHPELAAFDAPGFVALAVALAGDLPRLAALRAALRPAMLASPLMDGARFAGDMECAYRRMRAALDEGGERPR